MKRSATGRRLTLSDRLLAETVRAHEHDGSRPINDQRAITVASEAGGSFERRVINRARALQIADSLQAALAQLRTARMWVAIVGIILAVAAGVATARTALGTSQDGAVNFYLVLISILGVQTLVLIGWFIVLLAGQRAMSVGSLGAVVAAIGRRVTTWIHRDSAHAAAIRATGGVYSDSRAGRWTLSAISHAIWAAFNVGCLGCVFVLLSTREYTFNWETTILPEGAYGPLTRSIAAIPDAVGFPTPTAEQIEVSRRTEQHIESGRAREAWSGLLLGSIVTYGLVPRLGLLLLCLVRSRWLLMRYRLETTLPGYQRLHPLLMPTTGRHGIIDPAPSDLPFVIGVNGDASGRADLPTGPPAIVGLEISRPKSAWPPTLHGVRWVDLGFIDSRDDRERALRDLAGDAVSPSVLVIVASLTTTPDRGVGASIIALRNAVACPVALLLSGGQALRERIDAESLESRVTDWKRLADEAGVAPQYVHQIDLDNLTDSSSARLAAITSLNRFDATPDRKIERAFHIITEHVARWRHQPTGQDRAELHRDIASLHITEPQRWRSALYADDLAPGDIAKQIKRSAEKFVDMLPKNLRRSPKWLAAGASAGALGCVAAATLISPVAIAALPTWSLIGAALGAVIQPRSSSRNDEQPSAGPIDFTEPVRAATLFALLLELQPYDEATITRVMDKSLDGDDETVLDTPAVVSRWLETARHRFDVALASERAR